MYIELVWTPHMAPTIDFTSKTCKVVQASQGLKDVPKYGLAVNKVSEYAKIPVKQKN